MSYSAPARFTPDHQNHTVNEERRPLEEYRRIKPASSSGRGRPPISPEERLLNVPLRLKPSQRAVLEDVGISHLRTWLDRGAPIAGARKLTREELTDLLANHKQRPKESDLDFVLRFGQVVGDATLATARDAGEERRGPDIA